MNNRCPKGTCAGLIIPINNLTDNPVHWYDINKGKINDYRRTFKLLTDYQFDNSHDKIKNIFGDLFAFSVSIQRKDCKNNCIPCLISVWNVSGSTSVYNKSFTIKDLVKDTFPQEIINQIKQATENYSKRIVNCSDCGKQTQVPFRPSGDRPVYCRDCYMKRKA